MINMRMSYWAACKIGSLFQNNVLILFLIVINELCYRLSSLVNGGEEWYPLFNKPGSETGKCPVAPAIHFSDTQGSFGTNYQQRFVACFIYFNVSLDICGEFLDKMVFPEWVVFAHTGRDKVKVGMLGHFEQYRLNSIRVSSG